MRIVSGKFRGTKLFGPGKASFRPTEDQTREALFNILQNYSGSFLDLYAGSGAVGLEAYSRGFQPVTFVEKEGSSLSVLNKNFRRILERQDTDKSHLRLVKKPVANFLKNCDESYDIVFCDPPYALIDTSFVLELLEKAPLKKTGTLIIEHESKWMPPTLAGAHKLTKSKKYGRCSLAFYARDDDE